MRQLEFQEKAGLSTEGFFFRKQLLCVHQFSELSSISIYIADKVLKDFERGLRRHFHGNANKEKSRSSCLRFCGWMKIFSEKYGQDGPTDIVCVLPSYLNGAELYKHYIKESPAPHVKLSTFYKLLKTKFGPRRQDKSLPWIRISKESTHSKCDVCLGLDQFLRKTKTEAEAEYGRSLKQQHIETYSRARIAVNEYIQKALTYPKEVLAFQVDGMDSAKSQIPRLLERSKQLTGMFRLPAKITGCVTTSSMYDAQSKVKFYINHGMELYLLLSFRVQC